MKIRQTEEAFGQGVTPVRREVEHLQVPEIVEGRLLNFLDKIVPQVKVGEVRVRGQAVVRQHSYPVHRHVQDLVKGEREREREGKRERKRILIRLKRLRREKKKIYVPKINSLT